MDIAFCHHLSLRYGGGGEKWLTQVSEELLKRGHDISIHTLPVMMDKKSGREPNLNSDIEYKEGWFHDIDSDVTYITYNPLNWINFHTNSPIIAGIHSHCYWQPFALQYGLLPNLANFVHMLLSRWEIGRFSAIHTVTPIYPTNHDKVYHIPNFSDASYYKPSAPKLTEFTVGYASRKVWQKGYDIFNEIKTELPNVNFVETGNVPEGKMPDFYSQNHLTIVPARVDTFGLVNVESNMCGTPVLSSGLPTHRALELPLVYASNVQNYVDKILLFQEMIETDEYDLLTKQCVLSSQKYDKNLIIDRLEDMLIGVANDDR
jgi:glycosyltransferase involved in cell wall biosynthesis